MRLYATLQVFEFVDTDMYKLIGSPQFLTDEHVKFFMYQMLVGLKYLHSAHVIHRDIKVKRVHVTAKLDLEYIRDSRQIYYGGVLVAR